MEFRSLYYFLTVAREENITRAAEKLHLTQPTLSRQLMLLEDSVGTQLIIRGKRKIHLTEAGMLLRSRAEEILNIVQKTEKDLLSDSNQIIGEIMIGMAECMAAHKLLPEILSAFTKEFPSVTYDFYTGNADLIKARIENGVIDIGILLEPVDMEKFDFIRLPQKEKWGIIVNTDSILATKEYIQAIDLKGIPLINTKRAVVQNEIANWFKNTYDDLNFIATYNLISNAISLVANHIGNVITIEGSLFNHDNKDVKFIPFEPALESGVVFAWKKQRIFSPALSKFIETIYHRINE
ncbi:LysR family transcriptional regulator [Clostridium nigeriense]|uniref:LysR family transcriptional regulator n=1 Tax=Clostridium nigeriense TaxID=1805470 RepID=UPI003D33DECA